MESILTSIKKLIGYDEADDSFDTDLIMHINSVLAILRQLGVGPSEGFRIKDESTTWDEFIPEEQFLDDVKTFVYLKVRLIFDPPQSSAMMDAMNRMLSELEWRINVAAEELISAEKEESQNGE